MLKALAIGAVIASLAHPAAAHRTAADDPPPPLPVVVEIRSFTGNGCPGRPQPQPPAVTAHPTGNASFDVVFNDYRAQVGPGATPADVRRGCQVLVAVQAPAGYSYTIVSRDFRGSVTLAAGAAAVYRVNAFHGGQPVPATQPRTVTGPLTGSVSFPFAGDQAPAVWSPCGGVRLYTITTEVRVNAGTSDVRTTSSAYLNGVDGLTVRWQRCAA